MKLYFHAIIYFIMYVTANDECSLPPKMLSVSFLNDHYMLTKIKEFTGVPPENIRFQDENIYYLKEGQSFIIPKDSRNERPTKSKISFDRKKTFVDDEGNRITNENMVTTLNQYSTRRTFKVVTDYGYKTDQMTIDTDKNRIFVIGYEFMNERAGSLYVFNTENPNIIGGRIEAERVDALESRVIKLNIDINTGKLIIVLTEPQNKWSINLVEPIQTVQCKSTSKQGLYKSALESAIQLAGEQILQLYEDAVVGKENSEILKRNKAVVFPNGGPTRSFMSKSENKPNYDPSAADNNDSCGKKFDTMSKQMEKLYKQLNALNERYNKLYSMVVVNEDTLRRLQEFKKTANEKVTLDTLTVSQVPKNVEKDYVCIENDKMKKALNDVEYGYKLLAEVTEWIQYIVDNMNEDKEKVTVDYKEDMQIFSRFGED